MDLVVGALAALVALAIAAGVAAPWNRRRAKEQLDLEHLRTRKDTYTNCARAMMSSLTAHALMMHSPQPRGKKSKQAARRHYERLVELDSEVIRHAGAVRVEGPAQTGERADTAARALQEWSLRLKAWADGNEEFWGLAEAGTRAKSEVQAFLTSASISLSERPKDAGPSALDAGGAWLTTWP